MSAENHKDEYFHNPYSSSATKFYDLNDHCILEILRRVTVLDLCAIKNTCKRFDALADYFFKMAFKALNFNDWTIKGSYQLLSEDEIKTILGTFGTEIDSITVNADNFEPESKVVLKIINESCGGPRLRYLKMVKFVIDEETVQECSHLWPYIEQLTIDKCYADDLVIESLIRKCTALTQLEMVRQMNTDGRCLLREFPNLQGFSLRSNDNFDLECMKTFLRMNPQLRTLSLMGCNFVDDDIFETIADHLVNLEALYIRVVHVSSIFETNLENLLRLQNLRKLEFNCGLRPILPFVQGLAMTNRIEWLGISSAELTPELCAALGNLKNLQVLKLLSMYDGQLHNSSFKSLAEQLPKLQELQLIECDIFTLEQVIEFIEHSPKLEKLVIIQCSKILPLDGDQFKRIADSCQKRLDKLQLSLHLDSELPTTKEMVGDDLQREYAHILRLVPSLWEDSYTTCTDSGRYFAEEGGAYDYDPYDEDIDDGSDDDPFEVNDPYNVWHDDFDDFDDLF